MRQETSKKSKKWIWLLAGAVVLLTIVGVVLAMLLGGQEEEPPAGGRADIYWNVDRLTYLEGGNGLSNREPADDGLYHIKFAFNGEHVEYTTGDKKLVNFIDSQELMGLKFDDDGNLIDAVAVVDVATEVGRPLHVQSVDGNVIIANTSPSMDALSMELAVTEQTQIYDVTSKTEFVGAICDVSAISETDRLYVYANELDEITHIFIVRHALKSPVYWRAKQFYNASQKETTREPDENGIYTIDFFCEGELVTLHCKEKNLVSAIDSRSVYSAHMGLELDEEGYIINVLDSAGGIGGLLLCERYWVSSFNGNTYTLEKFGASDPVYNVAIPSTAKIYDVGQSAFVEDRQGKQIDYLNEGDRVCVWTDTNGVVVLVYVSNGIVDLPVFFNRDRQYDSRTLSTTRKPDAQGYYTFELYESGAAGMKTYKTNDKAVADYLDSVNSRIVGLLLDGDIIIRAYDAESVFGNSFYTYGRMVDSVAGPIISCILNGQPGSGNSAVLSSDCKIYNASGYGEYGLTTLLPGDCIYAMRGPNGEVVCIFILRRMIGDDSLYFVLDSQYDAETKTTKRQPDEDGWYRILTAHDGKQVTLRTRSKAMVEKVEAIDTVGAAALIVSGDVVVQAFDPSWATGGSKISSGYRIKSFNDDGTITTYYQTREVQFRLADDCVYYNVSTNTYSYKGEVTSYLQLGDALTVFTNYKGEGKIVYVRGRLADKMYWKTEQKYDSTTKTTTRVPDEEGWYYVDLACDGEVKTYKTKNHELMSMIDSYGGAIGLTVEGDVIRGYASTSLTRGVGGNGVTNYDVVAINGNKVTVKYNLPGSADTGKTKTIYMSSRAKVYDISPTAEKFGAKTELRVGDRIRTYITDYDKDTHAYAYVLYRDTHVVKEAFCEHCNQVVSWSGWYYTSGMTVQEDGHYYLSCDMKDITSQIRIGVTDVATPDVILDLQGHTVEATQRVFAVYPGSILSVVDSVGDGAIKGAQIAAYQNGGVIRVDHNSTFNLYSGSVIDTANEAHLGYGGAISTEGGTINIYGGTVSGGTAKFGGTLYVSKSAAALGNIPGNLNISGGVINGGIATSEEASPCGGTIYVFNANFTMTGGKVTGGQAISESKITTGGNIYLSANKNYSFNISGGVIEDGIASNGGNIYIANGNLTVSGDALITRGISTRAAVRNNGGGNVFLQRGTSFTMEGGSITDGVATSYGGNITCRGGLFTISGGVISGGVSETGNGNNVFINGSGTEEKPDSDAKMIAAGGQIIQGDVYIDEPDGISEVRLSLTGAPVIENLTMCMDALFEVSELTEGTDITISGTGTISTPCEKAPEYLEAGYFKHTNFELYDIAVASDNSFCVNEKKLETYCEHCGQVALWSEWRYGSGMTVQEDGHYYLSGDLKNITSQIRIGVTDVATPDVVLDLQGHTVEATQRAFAVYPGSSLSVVDTVGDGAIKGAQIAAYQNGGVIRVDHNSTFNLYSGSVIDAATEAHLGYGGAISTEGGTINIYGGTVSGGTTKFGGTLYVSKSAAALGNIPGNLNISGGVINGGVATDEGANPLGGAIYVSNGNFTMTGGKVTGGQAVSDAKTPCGGNIYLSGNNTYKFEITGGTIEAGIASNGNGGNIYLANGVLTVAGKAVISGGVAERGAVASNGGGNIYGQDATVINIAGGEIVDGETNSFGGNIFARGAVTVSGGKISGGKAVNGGNMFVHGYNREASLTMTGGIVENGTATTGQLDALKAMVKESYDGDNIYVSSATAMISGGTFADDDGGNEILVFTSRTERPGVMILTLANNAELIANLDSKVYAVSGAQIFVDQGGVKIDADGDQIWCIEGYDVQVPSEPSTEPSEPTKPSAPTEPTTPSAPTEPSEPDLEGKCLHCGVEMAALDWQEWTGKGYLSASGHYYLGGDITPDGQRAVGQNSQVDVVVDLRGYTYKAAEGRRTFTVYNDSTLTILDSVGGAQVIGRYTADIGATINFGAGTVNLYGGTFSTMNTENGQNGGVIALGENCTLNVYNGATIIGGPAKFGGAIYANKGNVNICGGTISGGNATNGGAVYVTNGTFTMSGGTISCGNAVCGGNVYINMSDTTITGGTIENGIVSSADSTTPKGGNIYMYQSSKKINNISGGTISGGKAENGNGGNIYVDNAGILNLSGSVVISGGEATRTLSANNGGGNVYMYNGTILNISGGTISGGVATNSYGGNILARANVTMTGGKVCDGIAINGGNLLVSGHNGTKTFNFRGGVIENGTATVGTIDGKAAKGTYNGDNVYINSAIMNISGGMITDNNGGNAILAYTPKAEYLATINLTLADAVDLAAALNGKVYIISGSELNLDFGNTAVDSDQDIIWYSGASIPEATDPSTEPTEPSTEATEPTTEPSEPSTEPTEPVKPEFEAACPCHGLTVTQIDEITKASASDAKAWVDFDGTALADGVHYRLNSDLTLTPTATSAVIMVEGEKSMLNLNGHNITVFVKGVSRRFVHMADNCQLTICGNGEISGNGNGGGVVFMRGGTIFNLYDATLTNTKVGGTARGGVIFTEKPTSGTAATIVNMYSGTLNAGAHSSDGGAICLSAYGQLNMYGGTLNGTTNEVAKKGGAIYTTTSSCEVNIYGGTINAGANTGDGSSICMYSSPMLKIAGGIIYGTVYTGSATAGAVQLSGAPVIEDLQLVSGASIALGEGGITGGSIGVTAEAGAICVSSADAAKSAAYFTSNVQGLQIIVDEYNQVCLAAEAQSVSNMTKAIIVDGLKGKMLTR